MILTPSLTGGGAQKSAAYLSLGLNKYYDVKIISINDLKKDYDYGGDLIELHFKTKKGLISKLYNFVLKAWRIYQIKQKYKPDVVISFMDTPNLLNVFTKRKEKTIVSIRDIVSQRVNSKRLFIRFYLRLLNINADYIIPLCEYSKQDLINVYGMNAANIVVINNICDIDNIDKWTVGGCQLSYEYIISVGRLDIRKGHWHLLRAFAKVHKEISHIKLLITGEGEQHDFLKRLISDLGLDDEVILMGWKNNPYDLMKHAKLLVFTSICEGFGNVLLEALALSKAIVASDAIGGSKEILCPELKDGVQINNIFFSSHAIMTPRLEYDCFDAYSPLNEAEKALAEAIVIGIKDKNLRSKYEESNRRRAMDYRQEIIINKWKEIIEK